MKILIHNIKSKKQAIKACKFLQVFTLSNPYPPFILSAKEYHGACSAELIKPLSYFSPQKNHYCIVMDSQAFKYNKDIDKMRQAFSDFVSGWNAAKKLHGSGWLFSFAPFNLPFTFEHALTRCSTDSQGCPSRHLLACHLSFRGKQEDVYKSTTPPSRGGLC